MKIAQISPLYEAVPPRLYGGTERVVSYLCEALVDAGHDVTLFASGDARTTARLEACRDQALRLDPAPLQSDMAAHLAMLARVRERAYDFDILHFHLDLLQCPFFEDMAARTVTTLHGRLDVKDLGDAFACWPMFPRVSISDPQRLPLPDVGWAATIHHGLPAGLLPFSPVARGGYLAFLGRISPEKRLDRAIAIARRAGLPLRVAAKVDAADRDYYRDHIEPLLHGDGVEFIGEIDEVRKAGFLGEATALLFPIDWPEPFGLVMIEAMACGTPVVAWNCGSVPGVIDDGVTGRIVQDEDAAVAAVAEVAGYDRARIRAVFERRFTADVMARNYVALYEDLLRRADRIDRRRA